MRLAVETEIYNSPEGEAQILDLYDSLQRSLGVAIGERPVNTTFGVTHLLPSGPEQGPPVLVTHGGNSSTPQGLRGLIPLLRQGRYGIYAPETIGHAGLEHVNKRTVAVLESANWRESPHLPGA